MEDGEEVVMMDSDEERVAEMDGEYEMTAEEAKKMLTESWASTMEEKGEFEGEGRSGPHPVRLAACGSPPCGNGSLSSCSPKVGREIVIDTSAGLPTKRGRGSVKDNIPGKKVKRCVGGADGVSITTNPELLEHYSVADQESLDEIPELGFDVTEHIELPSNLTRQQEDEMMGLGAAESMEQVEEEMETDENKQQEVSPMETVSVSQSSVSRNESKIIPGFGIVEYVTHEHPFAKYQGTFDEELPDCTIERLERKESLSRVQRFRDISLGRRVEIVGGDVETLKLDQSNETLYAFDYPNDYSVMYSVVKVRSAGAYLTPVKLEVVAGERVDLHSVLLTKDTVDTLSGKTFNPFSLYRGDLIIVETLTPRKKYTGEPLPTSWDYVGDPEEQTYWEVGNAQQVRRIIKKGRWALAIDEERKGRAFRTGDDVKFLVQDVTQVATFPRKSLSVKREILWDYVAVDVVVPVLQPGRFCRTFKPTYSQEAEVVAKVQQHNNVWCLQPTILQVYELKEEVRATLNNAKSWFMEGGKPTKEQFEQLAELTRFGVITSLAMSSFKFDPRSYKAEVTGVEELTRYCILTVLIGNPPSQNISSARWQKGTAVVISFRNHIDASATVLSSVASEVGLSVRVKIVRKGEVPQNITAELPVTIIIRHRKQDQMSNLRRAVGKLTPPPCTEKSHAMLVLADVHGGRMEPAEPLTIESFSFTIGSFTPTKEQSEVFYLLRTPDWRGAIIECGPGVGKTTAVTAAIIHNVECRGGSGSGLAVGTGSTNASVSAMIRSLRARDIRQSVRFVRLVTASNLMKLDSMHHSQNDFPHLWVSVFRKYVMDNDSVRLEGQPEMLGCAARHLCARQEFSARNLKSAWLREQTTRQYRTDPPEQSVMQLLFNIFDPHLILGTSDSIRAFFSSNSYLATLRETVEYLWIDESSQLGRSQLVPICYTFPTARVVMVGDSKQLPPYREQSYPDRLNALKNGPLFANLVAEKVLPILKLSRVYRCPTQIVELFSGLFYGGKLVAHKQPQTCQPFQSLGLPSGHPVLVVDTRSGDTVEGTSRVNDVELELAVKFVKEFQIKNPRKSIGVLGFYAAQVARVAQRLPSGITVATLDGSQGNEYDLVLLLTTLAPAFLNNKFISDRYRLNVALSRPKEALVIFANLKSANTDPLWAKVLDSVPKSLVFQRGDSPLFSLPSQ